MLAMLGAVAHAAEPSDCVAERKRAAALRQVLASVGETTAEYRAMMLKRIQEAEDAATKCEQTVAEQKRADASQLAARRREAEAEAKKAADERFAMDDLRSQASFLRTAWSAYECRYEKEHDDILNNPFATAEQRDALKRGEAMIARIRGVMKRGKLAQLPCRTDAVAKLAFCIADKSSTPQCGQAEMALMLRAEREVIAAVQTTPSTPPLTPAQQKAVDEETDSQLLTPEFNSP
jgi:hypothetical protein